MRLRRECAVAVVMASKLAAAGPQPAGIVFGWLHPFARTAAHGARTQQEREKRGKPKGAPREEDSPVGAAQRTGSSRAAAQGMESLFERVFLPVQPCRLACIMPLSPAPRSIRVELMPACASKRSVHATRSLWILRQRFKSIYGMFFPPPRILGRCFSYLGAALACCTSLHPRSLYFCKRPSSAHIGQVKNARVWIATQATTLGACYFAIVIHVPTHCPISALARAWRSPPASTAGSKTVFLHPQVHTLAQASEPLFEHLTR